jgi:hypothetical protein
MNKLILTHMWLDSGLLLARDNSNNLFFICTEEIFLSGAQDSLKKGWTQTSTGVKYRKIKKTKQCYNYNSAVELVALTKYLGLSSRVKESFTQTYLNN